MDPNAAQAAQGGVFVGSIVCGLVIGLPVGALILKFCCWICREEQPTFGSAVAITFANVLVQMAVGFGGRYVLTAILGESEPLITLILAVLNVLISGAVISAMLPTSYGKGLIIALLPIFIVVVLGLGLAFLVATKVPSPPAPERSSPIPPKFESPNPADSTPDADLDFFADALREIKTLEQFQRAEKRAAVVRIERKPRPKPSLRPDEPAGDTPAGDTPAGVTIDRLLANLDSDQKLKIRMAADQLGRMPLDESRQADVCAKLVPLLDHSDGFVRWSASNGLKTWANLDAVPGLIRALDDANNAVRGNSVEALIRLQDPRGAEALVERLKSHKSDATGALKKFGPAAEPAVLVALNDNDWNVRADACEILKEIGTGLSVADLKKHLRDDNGIVRMRAEAALNRIGPDTKPPAPPEAPPPPKAAPKKKRMRL